MDTRNRMPVVLLTFSLTATGAMCAGWPELALATPDTPYSQELEVPWTQQADLPGAEPDCADRRTVRNRYFGDLHIHTGLSQDAWVFGMPDGPREAYEATRPHLDFAAATDHAEFLQEVSLCTSPGSLMYEHEICLEFRGGTLNLGSLKQMCKAPEPIVDAQFCEMVAEKLWYRIRREANEADDPCEFTAFIGYEFTLGSPTTGASLHRNVIFADDRTPEHAVSAFGQTTPDVLWDDLEATCLLEQGCDVLAIAHNPNQSEGEEFATEGMTAALASLRASREPLVEIFQHKGNSECYPFVGNDDPECAFEQSTLERIVPVGSEDVPPSSFVRTGLKDGLTLQQTLGVNPFRIGFVGGTDTHVGVGGLTVESAFNGHVGTQDESPTKRLSGTSLFYNPGGLTGVWATQNTRQAIFDALRRREVFATSGTRLSVRFFGGWDYGEGYCQTQDLLASAYQDGQSMGSELTGSPGVAPAFLTIVQRDPDSAPIQEIQIIKGWLTSEGTTEEQVHSVVSYAPGTEPGMSCLVWRDPQFDPLAPAFYYARAFEAPTPRWSTFDCQLLEVDCADPQGVPPALAGCCDGSVPENIRERAWGSPIWYRP